jgi:hypothetical protein|nr:hypothetical protein [Kofleriaceae bacterium]
MQRVLGLVVVVVAVAACQPPGYGSGHQADAAGSGGGGGGGDAAVAAGDGGSGGSATADANPATSCAHQFRLDQFGEAQSVWVSGDFVSWAPTPQQGAIQLVLGADSGWTGSYTFPPGSYQYKFIVDGTTWILDPMNSDTASDGMGDTNSVYVCQI